MDAQPDRTAAAPTDKRNMNFMRTILIAVSGYRMPSVFTIHDESMTG
jgi:hypothetical protein